MKHMSLQKLEAFSLAVQWASKNIEPSRHGIPSGGVTGKWEIRHLTDNRICLMLDDIQDVDLALLTLDHPLLRVVILERK